MSAAPADATTRRRHRDAQPAGWMLWLLGGVGAVAALFILLSNLGDGPTDAGQAAATAGVVVGTPGGAVIPWDSASPSPSPTVSPSPTASAAPSATAPPSAVAAATPAATPAPTVAPTVAPTQAPATPVPPPSAPSPAPSAVVVAVAGPTDAVAAFYAFVTDGEFDAAYALWSSRMQAAYPREENLDDRFASTADITFSVLSVVEQSSTSATVQANFTETYDSGESRSFVGYWRLVQVDGRWLLDEPTY